MSAESCVCLSQIEGFDSKMKLREKYERRKTRRTLKGHCRGQCGCEGKRSAEKKKVCRTAKD